MRSKKESVQSHENIFSFYVNVFYNKLDIKKCLLSLSCNSLVKNIEAIKSNNVNSKTKNVKQKFLLYK